MKLSEANDQETLTHQNLTFLGRGALTPILLKKLQDKSPCSINKLTPVKHCMEPEVVDFKTSMKSVQSGESFGPLRFFQNSWKLPQMFL